MKAIHKITSILLAAVCVLSLTGCKGKSSSSPGNIDTEMTFATGDKIAEIEIENYGTIKAKLFPDIAPVGVENFERCAKSGYYDGLKIHRIVPDMCIQGGSLNGDGTGGAAMLENGQTTFDIEVNSNARNFYGALAYVNEDGQNTPQFYIVNNKKKVDVTQISPDTVKAQASSFTEQKSALEENDPDEARLTALEVYYTNLADMYTKTPEAVINRYAEQGGCPYLDGGNTVFGQVFEGLDIIDKLSAVELTTSNTGEESKPKTDIIINSVKVIEYVDPNAEENSTSSSKKK